MKVEADKVLDCKEHDKLYWMGLKIRSFQIRSQLNIKKTLYKLYTNKPFHLLQSDRTHLWKLRQASSCFRCWCANLPITIKSWNSRARSFITELGYQVSPLVLQTEITWAASYQFVLCRQYSEVAHPKSPLGSQYWSLFQLNLLLPLQD